MRYWTESKDKNVVLNILGDKGTLFKFCNFQLVLSICHVSRLYLSLMANKLLSRLVRGLMGISNGPNLALEIKALKVLPIFIFFLGSFDYFLKL